MIQELRKNTRYQTHPPKSIIKPLHPKTVKAHKNDRKSSKKYFWFPEMYLNSTQIGPKLAKGCGFPFPTPKQCLEPNNIDK